MALICHKMAVNYHGKKFYNIGPWWQTYRGNLLWYFDTRKCRYCCKLLAPVVNVIKLFFLDTNEELK